MADFDPRWANSIAGIESGGEANPYAAVTPNPGGRRALGKYQVMEENLPEWTQAALGKPLTAQEYLSNPDAQEAVFRHRFGSYVDKYGTPEDAASAWFTGRPRNAQSAAAHDRFGTTGSSYVNKFVAGLDGPTAIQNAMKTQGGSAPMAFADDDTGALSTKQTLGAGVLMPSAREAQPGPNWDKALMGAASALAGVYSPSQAQALNQQSALNDKADAGYSLHQMADGTVMRINKNGRVEILPGNYAKPEKPVVSEYQKAREKANSDLYDSIDKDAGSAKNQLATIGQLKNILSDPNVYQGAGGDRVADLKKLGNSLGITNFDGVSNADVAKSLFSQLTLNMRQFAGGMPGSLSDKDLAFLQSMPGSLNNSTEANQAILGNIAKVHQRLMDVAKERDKYVAKNGKLDDGFRTQMTTFGDANRLFPDAAATPAPATAPLTSPKTLKTQTGVTWSIH